MKKYLALDLGTKTCGIAKSDLLGIAYPLEEYRFENGNYKKCIDHIIEIVKLTNIRSIVVGYPLRTDRTKGDRCDSVDRFINDLRDRNEGLLIDSWDESFSTIEARERLQDSGYKKEKIDQVIDMYSAVVILEDFLRNR